MYDYELEIVFTIAFLVYFLLKKWASMSKVNAFLLFLHFKLNIL
mgnify:CR=1